MSDGFPKGEAEPRPTYAQDQELLREAILAAKIGAWYFHLPTEEVRWSPEVERIAGLAPGEYRGTYQDYLSRLHPEDAPRVARIVRESIERAAHTGPSQGEFHVEHRMIRGDGSIIWVEGRGRVEIDETGQPIGIVGTVFEITERKRAEEERAKQEEERRLFTELATDYVYSAEIDAAFGVRTTVLAGSHERVTGYTVEEIERRGGWPQIIHPEDAAANDRIFEGCLRGEDQVREYRIIDAYGEVRWLRDMIRPVRDPTSGRVVRLVGGVTDITERKRLEEELIHARKLEAIGRLAGAVAHDFNNLLTVILSCVDLAKPDGGDEPEELSMIREAAQRGADLTRSLLTIGRRRIGRPSTHDVGELLASVEPMLRRALGETVELVVERSPETLPISIEVGQAHMMLLNLALNARDAMPNGGRFTLRSYRSELGEVETRPAALRPGSYVVLEAADVGHGIAPEVVSRVFEPFFTTKADGRGSGLGLATCYGVAHAAGGTITVESTVGRGATFRVYLPISCEAVSPSMRPVAPRNRKGVESILLVEDGADLRSIVARILARAGYSVVAAATGEEALSCVSAARGAFDLALVDVGLPGMSGVDLAERLRRDHPKIKILLTSGNPADPRTRQALDADQHAFLQKPYDAERLAERIRTVLDEDGEPGGHA